ncbi:unnamed protein product [marine sediment metagenome]|uniref:Uncharacterized protein n=1 Tax=marine sediment metagenome TaxID=412755 RepID=X0V952_9ZZZZ
MGKLTLPMLIALIFLIQPAFAAKGVVVAEDNGDFVVESPMGYAILEWFGGSFTFEGNTIVGDFESYGIKTVYDLRTGQEIRVWVDEYWLSRNRAIEKWNER